ncbi:uncharacterized protein PFL1_05473 [Pseudozyma flocculosa PF-1]|uniref:AP-3 complex subunit delta n=2 Tax=Pseudozyma flocculosa TaxID=84751 RepID=A0A5C3FCF4_9BASI|nr:uncharacterized protein PFL1_05473 [Pseudozyma flocculosa PF-1]EPQ26838.1 hypothetical protein PFL1_05473 [Pseudozyma flocculosa PF-1]SPO42092.1 related to Adapter-related protein complex 3 delta 1 subunit [Pseudozyma flocculosa]
MFERSLSALIKGLRSHRGKDEAKYVAQVMDEIRHEVRSGDMDVKAEAVLKLTYLQMLGYPFADASFHMLEVMASPRYHLKHIGYLAAAQCFSQDTDVLILATNLVKKDLHSTSPLDVAVALNGLSHIVTPDLSRHLGPDTIALLTHTKPMIRKKALLVLYSMIIKCPEMLDHAWDRLREKLDDPDLGVVSAAVNIVCELARRDPRPFLPLAPQLFHLLTTSTNNWMLIKVIKLFGSLTPLEPRLIRKLVPPITTIISNTPAMSLLYECIHTVIIGGILLGDGGDDLAVTCVDKLARFLEDADQNLKYISLLALVKILPTHPHLVAEHQEIIFQSIEDPDLSIRLRALELVGGMASAANLQPIVSQLLSHLEPPASAAADLAHPSSSASTTSARKASAAAAALKASLSGMGGASGGLEAADPSNSAVAAAALNNNPTLSPSYRLEIVRRILALGSADTYANVHDFQWYLDVLVRLALIANVPEDEGIGGRIRDQIIDITTRVRAVRPYAARTMVDLLRDPRLVGPSLASSTSFDEGKDMRRVLHAAAWVCGEYCEEVPSAAAAIPLLLQPSIYQAADAATAAACVHNAVKLFAHWTASLSESWSDDQLDDVKHLAKQVIAALDAVHTATDDAEVQERTTEFRQLFRLLERDLEGYKGASRGASASTTTTSAAAGSTGPPGSLVSSRSASPSAPSSGPSGPKSLNLLSPLFFNHTLGPVAEKAQAKVSVPEGLELESWIVPQDWLSSLAKTSGGGFAFGDGGYDEGHESWLRFDFYQPEGRSGRGTAAGAGSKKKVASTSAATATAKQGTAEEKERRRQLREERMRDDPFYIGSKANKAKKKAAKGHDGAAEDGREAAADDIDSIPVIQLDLSGLNLGSPSGGGKAAAAPPVLEREEMPERARKPKSFKSAGDAGAATTTRKKAKSKAVTSGTTSPSAAIEDAGAAGQAAAAAAATAAGEAMQDDEAEGGTEPLAKLVKSASSSSTTTLAQGQAGTPPTSAAKKKKKRANAAEILLD